MKKKRSYKYKVTQRGNNKNKSLVKDLPQEPYGSCSDLIDKYIWVRADICHGKPCFKGTRIMLYLVIEMIEHGAGLKEIREAYPELTPQHIKAALHYAARVLEEREFEPSFLK